MHILITGANGHIGKALTARLLASMKSGISAIPGMAVPDMLTLMDVSFSSPSAEAHLQLIEGDMAHPAVMAQALSHPVDCVFHLASIPGGRAENDFDLAQRVNLHGTMLLLEGLRGQARRPMLVFASTIGVYPTPLPPLVTDDTPAGPNWTYGTQKLIGELLVADYSRKGWIDGRSIRLPGIIARPAERTGALSIFFSDLVRELANGRHYVCPVSAQAIAWLMSTPCCLDNLLHAAAIDAARIGSERAWTLPALVCSIGEIVQAIADIYGKDVFERISYAPDPALESKFGRHSPLQVPRACAIGFRHDGSIESLVRRALHPS